MSFKTLALATAAVTFALGVVYVAAGTPLIASWRIEPTASVLLFGRRIGAAYLGFAVMFFFARSVPASPARTAMSAGAAVTTGSLALLGVYELSTGRVGPAILASVAVEALLALGYILLLVGERKGAAGA